MNTFSPPQPLDSARWSGLRIGLLGGSFNPPHAGHVHISLIAMAALQLDFVWWLVTPRNPLKKADNLLPYQTRVDLCRKIIHHPKILVSDLEQQFGTIRTIDTLEQIKLHFARTNFVMITGLDNAHIFHRWHRWRDVLDLFPTAHVARPPALSLIQANPLRMTKGMLRHSIGQPAARHNLGTKHVHWLLGEKLIPLSSTALRAQNTEFGAIPGKGVN